MDLFVGSICMTAFNWAPKEFAICDGSILLISTNQALFTLLSNRFGGDGVKNFALPDMRGRNMIGTGAQNPLADKHGADSVTVANIPAHSHTINASNPVNRANANQNTPVNTYLGGQASVSVYSNTVTENAFMAPPVTVMANAGASQPLSVRNPYTSVNFLIVTQGVYPPRP